MKATGIVRRIDELGRVVIPKEIRRTQRIRRGDRWRSSPRATAKVIFEKVFAHWRDERSSGPVYRWCSAKALR